ncbi:lipopolysaccharide biosynthesis protein [Bowmanella denitrificans]|uniref:Lipopolysaccharide biosynthesis protein n=2 Tax=Bowmanella denitrificans TaxID=366582 RepID=A0ABN0XPL1_9ALTE
MRLLGLVSVVILARLLVPEDYGLIAKAIFLANFLEMITQFGFEAAIIRDQKASKTDFDTVWTLTIFRALILGIVLAATAPLMAIFFDEPLIENVIYLYAVATIVLGFVNVGVVQFRKDMNFEKDFNFNLSRKVVSFLVTIAVALVYKSYWAFPIGVTVGNLFAVVYSFYLSPFRPRITFESFSKIFHFSKWMFVFEFIAGLSSQLDTLMISKLGDNRQLGLFTVSHQLAAMPSQEVAMPVARSLLPGLSKLSDRMDDFRTMYSNIISHILLFAAPAAIGVSALSDEVAAVVLGEKWLDAGPYVEILALFGLARVIFSCASSALAASDNPKALGLFSLFNLLVKLALLPIGFYFYGVLGIVYAVLVTGVISMLFLLGMQQIKGVISLPLLLVRIWKTLVASLLMYLAIRIWLLPYLAPFEWSVLFVAIVGVVFGVVVFLTLMAILHIAFPSFIGPEQDVIEFVKRKVRRAKC